MTVRTLATTVLGAAAATLLATAASAAVTGGAITGGTASPGTFVILTPPFAVGNNNQQVNNRLFAWNEKQNVLLTAPLVTDLGGTILAGTRVASHGVVFDPVATRTVKGFVTFDRPILGVIWQTSRLVATDGLLGLPTITYNSPSARGLEARDIPGTSFAGNTLLINDWQASSPGDNIRVITAAVPEPATWAMLITGFGMVGFALRRRQRALSAA
ncbi:PEPxxWA-CTERM sorting domain-containing protein [Thermaurantiacus tibetensis]|uniref:PEPxxWA-CTERM sorting domain-containing protein n=1 Tax=Thermaurantiacus tibetensis TaxID=2759035 RepID=UPI001A9C7F2E|nr:PEPxxWA-CTERM sorting domain-containing protein [Thermaurantiacus tibetensis]